MAKTKTNNHFKNLLLDTLAEFYQDYIKKEMASKGDLKNFATKDDLRQFATKEDLINALEKYATKNDLDELEAHLMREIRENNRLIVNVEVSILDKLKNHELRIKVLEKFRSQFTAAS